MPSIKEAFQKVKKDIDSLKKELDYLKEDFLKTRTKITEMHGIIEKLEQRIRVFDQKQAITNSTDNFRIPTPSTHSSTHHRSFKPLKPQNLSISTGNRGVSTDRQTDRQTNQQTQNQLEKGQNSIDNAAEILNSLDSIKKDIRLKFKRLTDQEFLVFSVLYQFDEELGYSNYKLISQRLRLTESSIRDYIGRIIKKGIPVEKMRINNKNIKLTISENLKKIASLSTILQLRQL